MINIVNLLVTLILALSSIGGFGWKAEKVNVNDLHQAFISNGFAEKEMTVYFQYRNIKGAPWGWIGATRLIDYLGVCDRAIALNPIFRGTSMSEATKAHEMAHIYLHNCHASAESIELGTELASLEVLASIGRDDLVLHELQRMAILSLGRDYLDKFQIEPAELKYYQMMFSQPHFTVKKQLYYDKALTFLLRGNAAYKYPVFRHKVGDPPVQRHQWIPLDDLHALLLRYNLIREKVIRRR